MILPRVRKIILLNLCTSPRRIFATEASVCFRGTSLSAFFFFLVSLLFVLLEADVCHPCFYAVAVNSAPIAAESAANKSDVILFISETGFLMKKEDKNPITGLQPRLRSPELEGERRRFLFARKRRRFALLIFTFSYAKYPKRKCCIRQNLEFEFFDESPRFRPPESEKHNLESCLSVSVCLCICVSVNTITQNY
ncbi:hypothetical protein AVEN_145183-1 [Araneus ventricosus]|uniref:Uncharacterized protein n=1 Tax=Araneus ventricosus TaxID=182803 RepID=A0A4Y2PN85_ARAVE|nr:hypothetical protein AVEN_145183-1 [Araneus ventricosus]